MAWKGGRESLRTSTAGAERRGFTLLELVVTLAGIALAAGIRLAAGTAGGTPAATRGIAALDLEPDGDALPARIDLADASGRRASVVVPPAGGRPVVQGPDG